MIRPALLAAAPITALGLLVPYALAYALAMARAGSALAPAARLFLLWFVLAVAIEIASLLIAALGERSWGTLAGVAAGALAAPLLAFAILANAPPSGLGEGPGTDLGTLLAVTASHAVVVVAVSGGILGLRPRPEAAEAAPRAATLEGPWQGRARP